MHEEQKWHQVSPVGSGKRLKCRAQLHGKAMHLLGEALETSSESIEKALKYERDTRTLTLIKFVRCYEDAQRAFELADQLYDAFEVAADRARVLNALGFYDKTLEILNVRN
jgi:hypothetical protein